MRVLLIALLAAISYAQTAREMRVAGDADDDFCGPCVDAIKSTNKGCKRALKNKFYKIDPMPEECSGKLNPKGQNCRNYVQHYCEAEVEVANGLTSSLRSGPNLITQEMKVAQTVAGDTDDDICRPCAEAMKSQKQGCKKAALNKFKGVPKECLGKMNPKGPNCRNYVQDYCKAEVEVAKGITFDLTTFPDNVLNVAMYALAAIGFGYSVYGISSICRKGSTYEQVIENEI